MHKTQSALASIGRFFIGGFRTRGPEKSTRKFFGEGWNGRYTGRNNLPYPHSSARQQARYARQIAAGQLSMDGVEGVPASVRRKLEKLTKNKEYGRIGA